MSINSLHTLTVDGTTLALTQWDGIEQLRLSVAPIGKPSAVIEVTLAQMVALAKDVLRHAGYTIPAVERVEAPVARVDHAEASRLAVLEHTRRQQMEFNNRKGRGRN